MRRNKKRKILYILVATGLCLGVAIGIVALWLDANLTISMQEILFTVANPMEGANVDVVLNGMKACLPFILILWLVIVAGTVAEYRRKEEMYVQCTLFKRTFQLCFSKWMRILSGILSFVLLVFALAETDSVLRVSHYVRRRNQTTQIYEQKYVKPDVEKITSSNPKNVIYIYMESMENTYQSKEEGGAQAVNYMPKLTALAKEGISFSNHKKTGGFYSVDGTTWTTAALFASSSGVPFVFPAFENGMASRKSFAPNLVTLGDVLEQKGYNQMFLCGAPAEFGGIKKLLSEHGNYRFFDLNTAREQGYLPTRDYHNGFWGFEDQYLYKIAMVEISKLYQEGKPFNFTMMTMDTHFKDGYVCALCENTYPNKTANVVSCADRQVDAFVKWCQAQPFYADTVIVIAGDHLRMDKQLVSGKESDSVRTVYNCFLNVQGKKNINSKNRTFTAMDMFPTVLSAMGFEIPGNRLGLGTNLFSDKKTLAEEMGLTAFEKEINKYSDYYVNHFVDE